MALLTPLLAATASVAAQTTRVLFVGNSFTYVNDLPHQFLNVASGLGQDVYVDNSTIGGCTLYYQQPQFDNRTKELLQEEWDYIVLQDYSALPTVRAARSEYMEPAVGTFAQQKKDAKIVMYLTWGYYDGNTAACPSSDTAVCFPKGTLASMTNPPCNQSDYYHSMVGDFPCMGYSLIRGYLDMFNYGAEVVAPCGVSWQVVRGVTSINATCRAEIDQQYATPLSNPNLPLPTNGALKDLMLYRILPGNQIDKHPNVAGQYLNALTFYATLFNSSVTGAPPPLMTEPDTPLTPQQLAEMQAAVDSVVLQHMDVWHPTR
eukprot:TRINITY_DN20946_c0_g1_i1.p1 TRINITY_DN20946_c0_g1~~TRINITY_DN20946_c0_g1_i1.p1  ORF type:complete len:330 (+),score=69.18 TRINITY_DN20946_c0_g1_i1:39-992(+)